MSTSEYAAVRLLVAGCGSIGKRHVQVLSDLGLTKITACDPSAAQRESMQALFPNVTVVDDYDRALKTENFDAVFILTPTGMHIDMAKRRLKPAAMYSSKNRWPIPAGVSNR